MTPCSSIPCRRSRLAAFSLLEVMVAVSLLAVIIVGLLAMFFQVQRAFRAGTTQSDLMENGRAVMGLLARELQESTASRQAWVTNVAIVRSYGLTETVEASSSQDLPGGAGRTNYLKDLTFLIRQNDDWVFTSYRMSNAVNGVGTLYRLVARETTNNPASLHDKLATASPIPGVGNPFDPNKYSFHRVVDGVVHFYVEAYDGQGLIFSNAVAGPYLGNYIFTDRLMPAYLDIEFGVLDPTTLEKYRARAEADPNNAKDQYLRQRAGRVQMFRQRVVLRAPASERVF